MVRVSNVGLSEVIGHLDSTLLLDKPLLKRHPLTKHTCLSPDPQGITALWLVHIAPTHVGMARLS